MPEIITCPSCGKETYKGQQNCPHCGQQFGEQAFGSNNAEVPSKESEPQGADNRDEAIKIGKSESRFPVYIVLAGAVAIAFTIFLTQITIFVVQPIGSIPEGKTIVMWRKGQLRFVDSADGICARKLGGVSLLCRGITLGMVAKFKDDIILRLPYIDALYLVSTNGERYDR